MTAFMPIKPLLDLCPHLSTNALAERAGIDHGHLYQAIRNGRLRWDAADVAAIRLGYHPAILWPDEWVDVTRTDYHGARLYLNRLQQNKEATG